MIISEIGIRGFKSFGNNEQIVKLDTETGNLILMIGGNGRGKSSLIENFEYVLFGKVKSNKSKKWAKLSTLPNRINGEMLTRIKFKSGGNEIEVNRGISPNKLELIENGIPNDKAGKSNIDNKIEEYIGMDIETFKSFISLSINDFKNFISLTTEEKQILLDKLFNLQVINILNDILKEINKNNKKRMEILDSEIRTFEDSIESIRRSINKAIEKEKENIQQEIDVIIEQVNSKKEEYKTLKEKVEKIKEKTLQLNDELDIDKKQYINTQNDIRGVQKEIDLYDSGKCPTCSTDFTSEHFISLRLILVEKKAGYEGVLKEIESNIRVIKEKSSKLNTISDSTNKDFNDISYLLKGYKTKIDELNRKNVDTSTKSVNISEFQNTISELGSKKSISIDSISNCKEKILYYKELSRILSDEGVKKSIIAGIIKPLNHFISQNISKMGLPFQVILDDTFSAQIKTMGNVVEQDSLSTGENKLLNISILISYLMLIRTKKNINVLFLDEVFSSIDLENIDRILSLLRDFANEYKINIFVVHHAILNEELFDRIIRIDKDIFTTITEVEY